MKYTIRFQNPANQYIEIEVELNVKDEKSITFQLPAWRPGRYELGNFAKNIQKWDAFNENGEPLTHRKQTKDSWEVVCEGSSKVIVRYNYYANELNAGSSFLSADQLYVNPVNCCLYVPNQLEEICELNLDIPLTFEVAISLKQLKEKTFEAKNFDELADSPFITSSSLKHHTFKVSETLFHLWFQGEFKPDWELLERDFISYTEEQIKLFGDFPTEQYHYLFQILPHSAYHGVEHSASTVIALGPSYSILKKEGRYEDLLGVSSHELFHTWNIKRIRPIEIFPYDFSKENYSRLGYLAEGATTWYGDLMLYRSQVFDDTAFFRTFNQLLDRHYNNPGVNNLSVADSSFDTWLDGYSLGVPNRKSSIYTEGALITFMLDIIIRRNSKNENSFDDVLRSFYNDFYKQGFGISEADYKRTVEKYAQRDLTVFFNDFIYGTKNISDQLDQSLSYIGLGRTQTAAVNFHEAYLGIKLIGNQISMVFPNSPAEQAGLSVRDKIDSINSIQLREDLSNWLDYFKEERIELGVMDQFGKGRTVELHLSNQFYFTLNSLGKLENLSEEQLINRKSWMKT